MPEALLGFVILVSVFMALALPLAFLASRMGQNMKP
jgi:hypothetical protein